MNKAETSAVTADDDAAGDDDAADDSVAGDAEVRSGLDLTKAPPRHLSSDCILCPSRPHVHPGFLDVDLR